MDFKNEILKALNQTPLPIIKKLVNNQAYCINLMKIMDIKKENSSFKSVLLVLDNKYQYWLPSFYTDALLKIDYLKTETEIDLKLYVKCVDDAHTVPTLVFWYPED